MHGGGKGSFDETLSRFKNGALDDMFSMRKDGHCIVTNAWRKGTMKFDRFEISIEICPCCGQQRSWELLRGAVAAAAIEVYVSRDDREAWISYFLSDEISHLCHTSPCGDLFHIPKEPRGTNLYRNKCVRQGYCDGHPIYGRCFLEALSRAAWTAARDRKG